MKMRSVEIDGDDHELVIERLCAIDLAKASGNICVRLPHTSPGGQRISRVSDHSSGSRDATDTQASRRSIG